MKISVVIPSLANEKTLPYLKLCVESLRETTDWDIIVVTNGGIAKPNLSDIHGITIHQHTRDQGQCNAVNRGVEAVSSNTDYVLISNDDMVYSPGWTVNFRNHLGVDRKFEDLVWSPNLVEPNNNPGSAPPFLKLGEGFEIEDFDKEDVDNFVKGATQIKPHNEGGFNLPLFVRLDVWRTIGGYDEKYDPWGSSSDTDLQMKVELAGIKPIRYRDVLVYHFSNKSGTFDGTHQEEWWNNWNYLEKKWGFNRDDAGSDTWYCKDMIMWDKLKFRPEWQDKYAPPKPIEKEEENPEIDFDEI